MTLDIFNLGRFIAYTNCAQWDGTNHADILSFLRDSDPYNSGITDDADRWQVTSTSPDLVLSRPSTHPAGSSFERIVPLNYWVCMADNNGHVLPLSVPSTGSWTTTDQHGRPNQLNDLLASISATETLRPNATADLNEHSVTGTDAPAAVSDDSDSSYLRNNTGGDLEDRLNLGAPSTVTSGDTIDSIDVRFRARTESSSGDATVAVGLRLSGVSSMATTQGSIPTSATDFTSLDIPRPGGGSWSYADLADLQVVVVSNDGTADAVRVFEVWVDVQYTSPN